MFNPDALHSSVSITLMHLNYSLFHLLYYTCYSLHIEARYQGNMRWPKPSTSNSTSNTRKGNGNKDISNNMRGHQNSEAPCTLVIGFYDRFNLGDETYKSVMRQVLPVSDWDRISFVCVDDLQTEAMQWRSALLQKLPQDAEKVTVVVGGGDVINEYFMDKIIEFLNPVRDLLYLYAISVGIPYDTPKVRDVYLPYFDHVFLRSQRDYSIALEAVGTENATYTPDIAFLLQGIIQSNLTTSKRFKINLSLDAFCLPSGMSRFRTSQSGSGSDDGHSDKYVKIAFCPAQPMFAASPSGNLFEDVCKELAVIIETSYQVYKKPVELHLVPFNTESVSNVKESDLIIIDRLRSSLLPVAIDNEARLIRHNDLSEVRSPVWVSNLLSTMDCVITSRYHSAVFSLMTHTPIVALYTTTKLDSLLSDRSVPSELRFSIACDGYGKPLPGGLYLSRSSDGSLVSRDPGFLCQAVYHAIDLHQNSHQSHTSRAAFSMVNTIASNLFNNILQFVSKKKTRQPVVTQETLRIQAPSSGVDPAAFHMCLQSYIFSILQRAAHIKLRDSIHITLGDVKAWYSFNRFSSSSLIDTELVRVPANVAKVYQIIGSQQSKQTLDTSLDIAHLVCFYVTGSLTSPYVWGLHSKIQQSSLLVSDAGNAPAGQDCIFISVRNNDLLPCIYENVEWIRGDVTREISSRPNTNKVVQLNGASSLKMSEYPYSVRVDPYVRDSFSGLHRAGWPFALKALYVYDANVQATINPSLGNGPQARPNLIFDTYLDRTFHWGREALLAVGYLPYRDPWVGFIHHTFDTTFSSYNNQELFSELTFVESLKSCKALIVMSSSMADEVRVALRSIPHASHVQVHTVMHPTELPLSDSDCFSIQNFAMNPERKMVNIGAWLRSAYAIYQVQLPPFTSVKHNPWGIRKARLKGKLMEHYFEPYPGFTTDVVDAILAMAAKNAQFTSSSLDRQVLDTIPNSICRDISSINKYATGLAESILSNWHSVEIISTLPDNGYDQMLTQNIVFLHLVDAAACNTVVECVVRLTPIIVNRLPAVVEILGPNYPGLYDDLAEVPIILSQERIIEKMFLYLRDKISKDVFSLDFFARSIDRVMSSIAN